MEIVKEIQKSFAKSGSLYEITRNHKKTFNYLWEKGILKKPLTCCDKEMSLVSDTSKCDGFIFRCNKCLSRNRIRYGSFLDKHHKIPLIIYARIIFWYFCQGNPSTKVVKDLLKTRSIMLMIKLPTLFILNNNLVFSFIFFKLFWFQ